MRNRSSNANHYGRQAELRARERYGLEDDHGPHQDLRDSSGTPWESKATMLERADGTPGRFRIFEESHNALARADGWYAFTVYRVRGTGIEVVAETARRARALRLGNASFYGAGGHRNQRQVKLLPRDVF